MRPAPPSQRQKQLTEDEYVRVLGKVRALQQRTLLRPDLRPVFHYCDGLRITLHSGRIAAADVARLRRLFDEHGIV